MKANLQQRKRGVRLKRRKNVARRNGEYVTRIALTEQFTSQDRLVGEAQDQTLQKQQRLQQKKIKARNRGQKKKAVNQNVIQGKIVIGIVTDTVTIEESGTEIEEVTVTETVKGRETRPVTVNQ